MVDNAQKMFVHADKKKKLANKVKSLFVDLPTIVKNNIDRLCAVFNNCLISGGDSLISQSEENTSQWA